MATLAMKVPQIFRVEMLDGIAYSVSAQMWLVDDGSNRNRVVVSPPVDVGIISEALLYINGVSPTVQRIRVGEAEYGRS